MQIIYTAFNVDKYNLGKTVRLEPKQPAVSPLTIHDLQGGPQGICRVLMLYCITCAGQLAVLCRSFELLLTNLWGFLIFLLSPSCFAGFSVIFQCDRAGKRQLLGVVPTSRIALDTSSL